MSAPPCNTSNDCSGDMISWPTACHMSFPAQPGSSRLHLRAPGRRRSLRPLASRPTHRCPQIRELVAFEAAVGGGPNGETARSPRQRCDPPDEAEFDQPGETDGPSMAPNHERRVATMPSAVDAACVAGKLKLVVAERR